ncbi:MAG: DUF5693 family protein [Tissierellia bacterium]|nr:DUF5693 family protein [Tissierellia bacterium]
MKINKIDKIVLLLICISLSIGLVTIYQRIGIEKQYKTAEIVLDYNEMANLAEYSGENLSWWLENFKEFGAQSVAIQEETINLLIESGYSLKAEIVSQLIKSYNWEKNYNEKIIDKIKNGEIKKSAGIITTKDKDIFDYINAGLNERYTSEFYDNYSFGDEYYIVLHGTMDDNYYGDNERTVNAEYKGVVEKRPIVDSRVFNIGIGYDDRKITLAKNAGLDVILRPINYPENNEKLADAYKAANEKYGLIPRLYILHGKEILGFPENEINLIEYINENNIASVLIESSNQREHIEQEGLNKLVEKSNYSALRAFTMWDYIRYRYKYYNYSGAEEIENTMFRAIVERNIRVIYFKPFYVGESGTRYLTDLDEYERTFTSFNERLSEHNIKLGRAEAIKEFHIGNKRISIMCFGITLAAVLLFIKMFKIKSKYAFLLYVFALPGALVPYVMRNIAEKGFSLLAAIAFSGLAIVFFISSINQIFNSKKIYSNGYLILKSIFILLVSVAISLIGAVFVDATLADVKYFLEMDIFRGVKLAQIVPLGVFVIAYIVYFINDSEDNLKSIFNFITKILNKDIKVYYVILAGILGIVGYIYISRTGHETNLQPSNIEMIFRNLMENVLLARPRTKEFLIAFPALFAGVFAANKKSEFFTFIFMLASAIGTSSVINTFSHLRTPIYLSFTRTIIGVFFGIMMGCIIILIFNVLCALNMKIRERLK